MEMSQQQRVQLRLRKKQLIEQMADLQKQINEIDIQLLPFSEQERAALHGEVEMTYKLFQDCLKVCVREDNIIMYYEIMDQYPKYVKGLFHGMEGETNPAPDDCFFE